MAVCDRFKYQNGVLLGRIASRTGSWSWDTVEGNGVSVGLIVGIRGQCGTYCGDTGSVCDLLWGIRGQCGTY